LLENQKEKKRAEKKMVSKLRENLKPETRKRPFQWGFACSGW